MEIKKQALVKKKQIATIIGRDVYGFTTEYYQDWNGEWYFITSGPRIWHIGFVLSDYLKERERYEDEHGD